MLGLTWSLMPVAMWPTFTRRVSRIWMIVPLKSRMQTSTPRPGPKRSPFDSVCVCVRDSERVSVKVRFGDAPWKQPGWGGEWPNKSKLTLWCPSSWLLSEQTPEL